MSKIFVSVILTIILVLGINKITDLIFYVEKPEKSVYQVENVGAENSSIATEESSDSGNIMAIFASSYSEQILSSPFFTE